MCSGLSRSNVPLAKEQTHTPMRLEYSLVVKVPKVNYLLVRSIIRTINFFVAESD